MKTPDGRNEAASSELAASPKLAASPEPPELAASPEPPDSTTSEPSEKPKLARYDFGEVSEATRHSMQGNKRVNSKPEQVVRKMLRDMGFPGYRLDWKKAKGHPDIAYPGRKIAIFVHGCFWHHHGGCKYATTPKRNPDYWNQKFQRNQQRDALTRAELESQGWKVVVIWECELKKDQVEQTRERLREEISYAFVEF